MSTENTPNIQNIDNPYVHAGREIRRHLSIIHGRFWTILACLVIIFSISAIRAFRATDVYAASARLMVQRRHPAVTPFDDESMLRVPGEQYETHMQLIRSREVLEKALENPKLAEIYERAAPTLEGDRPGLYRSVRNEIQGLFSSEPTRPREPWERLRGRINTSRVSGTDLMEVTVRGTNPRQCALIANTVAKAYEAYAIEMRKRSAGETFESLQDLKEEQERLLREAEEKVYDFHEIEPDEEGGSDPQMENVDARLDALNSELTKVQMRLMDLEISVDVVDKAGTDMDKDDLRALRRVARSIEDEEVSGALTELQEKELERAEIPEGYGPRHPEVRRLETKMSILKDRVAGAVEDYTEILEPTIEMLRYREEALKRSLTAQNRLRQQKMRASVQLERMERDIQRNEQFYDVILERMRRVGIGKDADVANVQMVEEAVVPVSPFKPDRQRALFVGLLLGLFVGVGFAYVREWMDETIATPDDLEEQVSLPVLGYVPEIESSGMEDDLVEVAQHTLNSPDSPVSELFRSIRTNLYFSGARNPSGCSLAVVSAHPRGGKTVFSCNMAVTLARDGNRILLVDADLRRSRIHLAFDSKKSPGLTNVLIGDEKVEDVVFSPKDREGNPVENLHVLSAGEKSPNPAELIGGKAMGEFMDAMREKYDMVIYDTGASLLIADTTILASRSDGALMVVEAGGCRARMLERVKKQLDMAGCRIMGSVLNKVRQRSIRASYGYGGYYGYGYGYGYGSGYYDEDEEDDEG